MRRWAAEEIEVQGVKLTGLLFSHGSEPPRDGPGGWPTSWPPTDWLAKTLVELSRDGM